MAKYYNDCGWLPFGWGKTEAEDVGKCGPSTELKDGKCQIIVDPTTVIQTTFEYCRKNNNIPEQCSSLRNIDLTIFEDCKGETFLTDACRSQLETVSSLSGINN
tara:strand:- start:977 stop:1288 length:312 start_codon:yes stop_codon:yes gene_type:complete